MKKFMNVAVVALALCGLMLTSCGSTGGSKGAAASTHPRTYTFDIIDGGADVLNLQFNSYGPNYQCTPFFTNLVKKDKVQAGDTVTFKMKATTDVDLPLLLAYPCSTSPAWTPLDDGDMDARVIAKDVKAGETFDVDVTWVLAGKMGADFALCIQYDNVEQEVKTGGPCKLTLERVCESTDTTKEVPETPHNPYVEVDLGKYAAFLEVATNHPWVNGVQDMSVISNYEAGPEVTNAYGDDLPKAGDKMHLTWKAVSDTDIALMHVRLVDRSAAANWWKELEPTSEGTVMIENIKAGEPFTVDMELTFAEAPVAQVNLCIWYDVGDAEGPAIFKVVKD